MTFNLHEMVFLLFKNFGIMIQGLRNTILLVTQDSDFSFNNVDLWCFVKGVYFLSPTNEVSGW